jgi:lysozyme
MGGQTNTQFQLPLMSRRNQKEITMAVNKETLELIKTFEGLELIAYYDPVGVLTIGYGHTNMAGPPKIVPGMRITAQEASDILMNDLKKYEAAVSKHVKVPLNQNQYGALVSFTYNLGEGNLSKSTLVKKLNVKDYEGAANEFPKWNKAGGKVLKGLVRRRAAEQALFRKLVKASNSLVGEPKPVPSVPQPDKPKATVAPLPAPQMTFWEAIAEIFKKLFGSK